jgi:selenocysteine-specific elongation factor
MTRITIGVMGHVDHGKTALVKALTGIETDRLPEERRRGISIALGFAHLHVGDVDIDLIDMPGHERFVRTMVAGASGIDGVLLVVAANEQVQPQTEEHVAIAGLLGIRHTVIVVSKCDLVTGPEAIQAGQAAAALRIRAGLQGPLPILTSARTETGLTILRETLAKVAEAAKPPTDKGFHWLPIDRTFSLAGHGTVVTGTLRHGLLTTRTPSEVVSTGLPVRIRALQVHGRQVDSVQPGQRVAVNLRGIEPAKVAPGSALGEPGLLRPATWLSVHLRLLDSAPRPLRTSETARLLIGTLETIVRMRLLDRDALAPGASCVAQIQCPEAVATPTRERFVLRAISPEITIGGGLVIDCGSVRLRRHAAPILRRLNALVSDDTSTILARALAEVGFLGTPVDDLARLVGLAPHQTKTLLGRDVVIIAGHTAILSSALDAMADKLRNALEVREMSVPGRGLTLDAFASMLLPTPSSDVLDEAVGRLVADGTARRDGGVVRLSRPGQEHAVSDPDAELAVHLAEALRSADLQPPDSAYLVAGQTRAPIVLEKLIRSGVIVRVVDRTQKRTLLFHRDAIRRAHDVLTPLLASTHGLLAREAGMALGVSRKYSIPLLEYFDTIRFTRRVGDRHLLDRKVAPSASGDDID